MMFLKLSHLFFGEVLFVVWVTLKWKWIVGILWLFFMINIIGTVFPIREFSCIWTLLNWWSIIWLNSSHFSFWRLNLKRLIRHFIGSWEFHFMRINNLMLLLVVKWVFLSQKSWLLYFSMIFLLIIGNHALGVRVFNKSICASGSSSHGLTSIRDYY